MESNRLLQVRVLSVAPDEAFFPSGKAMYYSVRPKAPGIVYALLPYLGLIEIRCSLDNSR